MNIYALGIDLGKTVCSLAGLDASGRVVLKRRIRRNKIIAFAANLPPCIIAMEACCGAHFLAHRLIALGHAVRLMPPEYVQPYVKAMKNDDRDAEAIAEAASGRQCASSNRRASSSSICRRCIACASVSSVSAPR